MVIPVNTNPTVEILGADDHDMSQDVISNNALKVLNRLIDGGFDAYLVGGGVRDALVGQRPKDFDVATDASPEEVRELFKNSRIIGRRFRLVHVLFGRDVIEVATFRAAHDKGDGGEVGDGGQIVRDNVFGTVEEDAIRRDFSVNALYYNIANNSITDYCGGLNDMRDGLFRLIGEPVKRCEEDPVRVLRAARLSAKLGFDIHIDTLIAMEKTRHKLSEVPAARMFEEMLKLFQGGYAERSFNAIREHGLLPYLFPLLDPRLENDTVGLEELLSTALKNTDARVAANKPITPYYLLSFMLWPDVEQRARMHVADGMSVADAIGVAADSVTTEQVKIIAIPRRFSEPMREVWAMQLLLEYSDVADVDELIQNRRFRAAYDFLLLRSTIDDRLQPLAEWWTEIQRSHNEVREELLANKPVVVGFWGESPEQLENLVVPVPPSNDRKNSRNRNRKPRQRGGRNQPSDAPQDSASESVVETAEESTDDSTNKPNNPRHQKERNTHRGDADDSRGNSRQRSNNSRNNSDDVGNQQQNRRPARQANSNQQNSNQQNHGNWDEDNRGNRALPEEVEESTSIYDDIQPEDNSNRDASELFGNAAGGGQRRQRGGRRHPQGGGNNAQNRQRGRQGAQGYGSGQGGGQGRSQGGAQGGSQNGGQGNGQQRRNKKRSARRRPDGQGNSQGNSHSNSQGNGQANGHSNSASHNNEGQSQGGRKKKTSANKGGQGMNGQRRRRSRNRRPRNDDASGGNEA